ncbi:hypothetical protein MMC31_005228, partial [Peltigera leucophlebia]|nr:hypothetical protein [Peltigera leucophlebia]
VQVISHDLNVHIERNYVLTALEVSFASLDDGKELRIKATVRRYCQSFCEHTDRPVAMKKPENKNLRWENSKGENMVKMKFGYYGGDIDFPQKWLCQFSSYFNANDAFHTDNNIDIDIPSEDCCACILLEQIYQNGFILWYWDEEKKPTRLQVQRYYCTLARLHNFTTIYKFDKAFDDLILAYIEFIFIETKRQPDQEVVSMLPETTSEGPIAKYFIHLMDDYIKFSFVWFRDVELLLQRDKSGTLSQKFRFDKNYLMDDKIDTIALMIMWAHNGEFIFSKDMPITEKANQLVLLYNFAIRQFPLELLAKAVYEFTKEEILTPTLRIYKPNKAFICRIIEPLYKRWDGGDSEDYKLSRKDLLHLKKDVIIDSESGGIREKYKLVKLFIDASERKIRSQTKVTIF